MTLPLLTVLETRVLGVLVEKEQTVPDIYPLSLNALTAGCNQKNNRDPVLAASEAEVQAAIDRLRPLSLVIESSGSRVMRYSHNVGRVLRVSSEAVALLATLWLRGAQTAAELRAASERLHRFADLSSVEGFLNQLATRPEDAGGPLTRLSPRVPGAREARWIQLLSPTAAEPPAIAAAPFEDGPQGRAELISVLREKISAELSAELNAEIRAEISAELARLRSEVAELRARIDRLESDRPAA